MEYFGVSEEVLQYPLHGHSLIDLLKGNADRVREGAVYGYFGKQVAYTDGKYTYFRAAADASNRPLFVYTAVPSLLRQYMGANDAVDVSDYDKIGMGRYLSWTDYPVYRFPADIIHFHNPSQEFSQRSVFNEETLLFDLENDYEQEHPVCDAALEADMAVKLKECMRLHDAPKEQFERLGL